MDFQCTQVIEDDGHSESSGYGSPDDKAQVGTLEIGNRKHAILRGLTKIGRHPACEICLENSTVSKTHAEIEANGKNVFICDLQSSNKTRLNDAILLPSRFYELQDGASLKFGVIEGRFFLKRSENELILAPETPEPGLRLRGNDSQDISVIEATPRPQDNGSFRRPAVPTPRKRISMAKHLTPEGEGNSQQLDLQGNTDEYIKDLEIQSSTVRNDITSDSNIQDMETQIEGSDRLDDHLEDPMNIQEMETQVSDFSSDSHGLKNGPGSSKNTRRNIQKLDAQGIGHGDDAEGASDGPRSSKKIANGNSQGRKSRIQDLDIQNYNPNCDEDLKDGPGRSKPTPAAGKTINRLTYTIKEAKPLEVDPVSTENIQELNSQALRPEDDAESAVVTPNSVSPRKVPERAIGVQEMEPQRVHPENDESDHDPDTNIIGKRKLEEKESPKCDVETSREVPTESDIQDLETRGLQPTIHDLQTQVVGPNDVLQSSDIQGTSNSGETRAKRISQYERELNILKADIFGSERGEKSGDEDSDDPGIYDLPTQSALEYSEALKRQKEESKVLRSQSSSPELINGYQNVMIDDSDEDSVFEEARSLSGNHRKEGNVGEGEKDGGNNEGGEDRGDNYDENHRVIGVNCDDKSARKISDRDKFKRNGIVSDSDSNDDDLGEIRSRKLEKSPSDDIRNSGNGETSSRTGINGCDDSGGETDFEDDLRALGNCSKALENAAKNSEALKNDAKSSGIIKETGGCDSECETDFEEFERAQVDRKSSKDGFKNSKSSRNHLKSSQNERNNSKSLKSNLQTSKLIAVASVDDTDFEDLDAGGTTSRSSKNDFKSSKSSKDDSKSSKSARELSKVIPASSEEETDFEEDPVSSKSSKNDGMSSKSLQSSLVRPTKQSHIISDSDDDETTSAKSPKISERCTNTSSVMTVSPSTSGGSLQKGNQPISISSESSGSERDNQSSRSSGNSTKSPKCPPGSYRKSSEGVNSSSEVVTIAETPRRLQQMIEKSSGSDTDHEDPETPSTSSNHGSENPKSSKKSNAVERLPEVSAISNDNSGDESDFKTPIKSSKKRGKPSASHLKGINTSDLPEDILRMIETSKNSEDDDIDDDDDLYLVQTQLIVQPKHSRIHQKNDSSHSKSSSDPSDTPKRGQRDDRLGDSDEDLMPTQKIDRRNIRKNPRDFDSDELDPTQVIPTSSGHHRGLDDDGDLESTQMINHPSSRTRQVLNFDDIEPTQVIDVHQPISKDERNFEEDIAPTQIIDLDKNNDSSLKKRQIDDQRDETRKRMRALGGNDPIPGKKGQHNLQQTLKNPQNAKKTRNSTARKYATIASSDSEDLENVPDENSHPSKATIPPRNRGNPRKSKETTEKASKTTHRKFAILSSDSEAPDDNLKDNIKQKVSKLQRNHKKPLEIPKNAQKSQNSAKDPKPTPKTREIPSSDSDDLDNPQDNSRSSRPSRTTRNPPEPSKNPQILLNSSKTAKSVSKIIKTIPSDSEGLDNASKDNPHSSKPPRNPPETSKYPQKSQKALEKLENLPKTSKKISNKSTHAPLGGPGDILKLPPGPSSIPSPHNTPPHPQDPKIITSTPFGTTPAKKRRLNLSLRSRKEAESKDSAFSESRSISNDKSSAKNPQSYQQSGDNLEDSITRDLDSMFGGTEHRDIGSGGFMMTQEVMDVLKSSQPSPESSRVQEVDKKSPKIIRTRGKVGKTHQKSTNVPGTSKSTLPEDDVDSQETHFTSLKGRKRAHNFLASVSSEDEAVSGFSKGVAVEASATGASSPRKSSRLRGKDPLRAGKGAGGIQSSPRSSSRRKIDGKLEEIKKNEICGISSRPVSSVPSTSLQVPSRGLDGGPGTSVKALRSPGRPRVERIPRLSLRKIVDKELIQDSEDEDDFENINKMADGFLISSGVSSPGRGRKTLDVSRIPKMQLKVEKELKTEPYDRSLRGRRILGKSQDDEVEAIVEVSESKPMKIQEKSRIIQDEPVTSRGRGRKKMEEVLPEVKPPEEVGRKRGRGRKNEEAEGMIKRVKREDSGDSNPGPESQEVRRILRGDQEVPDREERIVEVMKAKKGKVEDRKITEEVDSSPSRAVRSRSLLEEHRAQCVLFTGVKEPVNQNLVVALGGTVTDNPQEATILVTDKIRRTVKFFCAISRGIPIVSMSWLQSSMASKKFLDPGKYTLYDPGAEAKYKFNLGRSLGRARTRKLLEGRTIVLTSKLSGPSIPDLKAMVQAAGGKPLVRAPSTWPHDSIIVSCPEDLPKVKKMLAKAKNVKVHVVDIEFLLSGLLRQELHYEEFALKV
ncbi:uncharacterized protein LOC135165825 [Diachasmimorpha longicaudata]|uniref:uncharacterized protein LOC135165825 n=1 Tax=Diachasmimorpha longicaudata TaxID=58733 RepID=UPI0030B86B2D